jgi:predicted nucleic acid-binding protein
MLLAVDASVVLEACLADRALAPLADHELIAPPLLWSEVTSALHELRWRGVVDETMADAARRRLAEAEIARTQPSTLRDEAWHVADRLGWAKTYDAEYVALARLRRCPLLTVDGRLRRGAGRVVQVLGPAELDG